MASITTRNSRRSRQIPAPLNSVESTDVSHAAAKLHARRMKKTSRVIPAREQYGDHTREDLPTQQQTDRQNKPAQAKSFEDTRNKDYGAIKITAEMANVRDAIADMGSLVQKNSKQLLDKKTKASEDAIAPKEFEFEKNSPDLTPRAQRTVRRIVREELDATDFGGMFGKGGFPLPTDLFDIDRKNRGGKGRPGRAPAPVPSGGPTGTQNKTPTTQAPPSAQKAPTGVPGAPTGPVQSGGKPVRTRRAFNKSERIGAIFRKTADSKGYAEAIKKTAKLATPKISTVAGGVAIGAAGVAITGLMAKDAQNDLDQLRDEGVLTKEQHENASRELWFRTTFGTIGSIAAGIAGAAMTGAIGGAGAIPASIAGGYAGGEFGAYVEKATRDWTLGGDNAAANKKRWDEEQERISAEREASSQKYPRLNQVADEQSKRQEAIAVRKKDLKAAIPASVDAALQKVSSEFNLPYEDMVGSAELESGLRHDVKSNNSSATGLFQHTTDTWNNLVKNYPRVAEEHDIKKVSMLHDDRKDPYKSAVMYAVLRKENERALRGATTGNPSVDAYIMHMMGSSTGRNFIVAFQENPNQSAGQVRGITAKIVAGNTGIFVDKKTGIRTVGEVVDRIRLLKASKREAGLDRIAKSKKKREDLASIEKSPNSSIKMDATKSQQVPQIPATRKASETPTRIEQTAEATKVAKENQRATMQHFVIPSSAPQIIQAPPPQPSQAGAALTTRNDSPYLMATRLQEALRQK